MENKYTTDDYIVAFRRLNIAPHQMRMLQVHYYASDRTLTATQMSKAMGYRNFNASNLHYGKLARLVGENLGWNPMPETTLFVLAEFEKPGREWLWLMRPQVAQAMERLEWTDSSHAIIPEEIDAPSHFYEGSVRTISVNAHERSVAAREKCILHYGCICSVCGIILANVYGEIAQGHIHVHHLQQLADINAEDQVDPIQDLRPVCPNCHAMIHLKTPPYTIDEIMVLMEEQKIKTQC